VGDAVGGAGGGDDWAAQNTVMTSLEDLIRELRE
jgi:hypothetical protein